MSIFDRFGKGFAARDGDDYDYDDDYDDWVSTPISRKQRLINRVRSMDRKYAVSRRYDRVRDRKFWARQAYGLSLRLMGGGEYYKRVTTPDLDLVLKGNPFESDFTSVVIKGEGITITGNLGVDDLTEDERARAAITVKTGMPVTGARWWAAQASTGISNNIIQSSTFGP